MKKLLKLQFFIFSLFFIFFDIVFGQGNAPLVHCDYCKFNDALILIKNIIDFILFKLLMPIVAIIFAYAGFLLLFSGGNSSKKDKAKTIFLNTAIGFVIALGAWLIVKTIINILGFQSDLI